MVTLRQKKGSNLQLKQYTKYKHNTNLNNTTIKPNKDSITVLQEWYHSLYLSRDEWKRNKSKVMASKIKNGDISDADNAYIPNPILPFIQTKTIEQNIFTFQINDQTIIVRMASYSQDQLSSLYQQKCLECIYTWIHFIQPYRQPKCSKQLTISLYLTPFKKKLPAVSKEVIDTTHVNTAFTYACMPTNTIHIFREEEWQKVMFHETFHAFGIDFSHMESASNVLSRQIQSRFHLQSPPAVFEAYTELCAEIMHLIYMCLISSKTIALETTRFYQLVNKELDYSFYQCAKILGHYQTNYLAITQSASHAYKENSNVHVFSYFMLKTMLMFSFDAFILYIKENGGFCFECSKRTVADKVQHLYEIITNSADNPTFIKEIQIKENGIKRVGLKCTTKSNECIKRRTLRMTSI